MSCLGSGLRFATFLPSATPWLVTPRPTFVAWPMPPRTVSKVLFSSEFRAIFPPASKFVVYWLGCRGDNPRNVPSGALQQAVLRGRAEHHLPLPDGFVGTVRSGRGLHRPRGIADVFQGQTPAQQTI